MIPALAFGLAFAATFAAWLSACARLHALDEVHHLWIGVALALSPWGPPWVGYVGLVVMVDDCVQHLVQLRRPEWRSPLHLAYRHLIYNPACGVLAWACAALFSRGLK